VNLAGVKNVKTGMFMVARTGSTRLPGKALLKINGETITGFMIDRLKKARLIDVFVLCTTDRPEDGVLADLAHQKGIESYRGSATDILARELSAAQRFHTDFIVNVDGDDVFCDPGYVERTVEHFTRTAADFIRWVGLPLGASPIGISAAALSKVCTLKENTNTETGWGSFFTETGLFKVETIEESDPELRHPEIRMTMDYPEDYAFVKEVYRRLGGTEFRVLDIMRLIKENPAIAEINKHLQEGYFREFNQKRVKVRLKKPT
jgi:spore coat polysaccharide biosynthesis protein SpsF (cytidylyltransferase family)